MSTGAVNEIDGMAFNASSICGPYVALVVMSGSIAVSSGTSKFRVETRRPFGNPAMPVPWFFTALVNT